MKSIYYWSPFLTDVATVSAVIQSAISLRKYSKKYNPVIIDVAGEFQKYNDIINDNKIELKKLINLNYINFLPKNGYIKSAHLDRRDHLVHILFYSSSEKLKGGEIKILKLKKHKKVYDIFPSKKDLIPHKRYKVKNNFCLFTLNVPWSYHSVSKYIGKKDRKYFYVVYDFPSQEGGAKLKNRQRGNNQNSFWNSKVQVESRKRKSKFFSE